MIRARFAPPGAAPFVVLGLSKENIQRLQAGQPIAWQDPNLLDFPGVVYIVAGETEKEICKAIGLQPPR